MKTCAKELERRMPFALERAAQAWCMPATENKVMDSALAKEFAKILVKEMYAPHLGCATTKDLLTELEARMTTEEIHYKTVPDDCRYKNPDCSCRDDTKEE